MAPELVERKLTAILSADVVGYSRLMAPAAAPQGLEITPATRTSSENAAWMPFHRVGAQDVLPHSSQILQSGRLLPFWLDGLELRRGARGSARAAAESLRVARTDDSV